MIESLEVGFHEAEGVEVPSDRVIETLPQCLFGVYIDVSHLLKRVQYGANIPPRRCNLVELGDEPEVEGELFCDSRYDFLCCTEEMCDEEELQVGDVVSKIESVHAILSLNVIPLIDFVSIIEGKYCQYRMYSRRTSHMMKSNERVIK